MVRASLFQLWLAVVTAVLLVAPMAAAVTIDFDGLSNGASVTNQFAEATFSADPGQVTVFNVGSSADTAPNLICSDGCVADLFVDFTDPVDNLTFAAIAAEVVGMTAQFNVFENGILSATVPFMSIGASGSQLVDLSAFSFVTRLEIVNILDDPMAENGIGWDTFSFDIAEVPEPGTGLLLGLGLAGLAIRRRRSA